MNVTIKFDDDQIKRPDDAIKISTNEYTMYRSFHQVEHVPHTKALQA